MKMKNQKKNKKSGFTLVELMVVAIIVAILAAVAIPMMTGNTEDAKATEGRTGCGAVATQIRMWYVENGIASNPGDLDDLSGIELADLKGTYYDNYTFKATGKGAYVITASPIKDGKATSVVMTVVDGATEWN